jgi:hypothetical protein
MPNILTATQAANALRVSNTDVRLVDLLPQVDEYIKNATGHDWSLDATINPTAISAATLLIVQWFDNPSMIGTEGSLGHGLTAALTQLEALALKYRKSQFEGISGGGSIYLPGALKGDDVISLVGVYGLSGSQSSKFESEISEDDYILQTYSGDLSDNLFVVVLKSPKDDIVA